MCSTAGGEDFCSDLQFTKVTQKVDLTRCKKCLKEEEELIVLRKKDVYCRSCFTLNSVHKFRSTLGKNKAIRPGDEVVVAFDGGQSSLTLLHLLNREDPEGKKRVEFGVEIVVMDDGEVNLDAILKRLEGFPFKRDVIRLDKVNFEGELTARESMKSALKHKTLIKYAEERRKKLFTAETMTSLAVKLMSNMALGRGQNLASDVAFKSNRIYRPLREFSDEEIDYYCKAHRIEEAVVDDIDDQDEKFRSVKSLTRNFVSGLQRDFPATVPTIFKTGGKLDQGEEEAEAEMTCILCCGKLDNSAECGMDTTAVEATKFSEIVSREGVEKALKSLSIQDSKCAGHCDCKVAADINEHLCYACKLTVKGLKCDPEFLLKELNRQRVKHEIKDFLL